MSNGGSYLDEIKDQLLSGRSQWKRGDLILRAFGYVKRRQSVVDQINAELESRGMTTSPLLSPTMPLDRAIRFYLAGAAAQATAGAELEASPTTEAVEVAPDEGIEEHSAPVVNIEVEPPPADPDVRADRSLIVGNLECAEREPTRIAPTASVQEALTVMDLNDFSQLVVSTGPRDPKGTVSYKSIARAYLHGVPKTVGDCLDASAPRVFRDEPLLDVVGQFAEHDAVLILGPGRELLGIVTPTDMATEFGAMAGPFLIIGQIEDQLRWLAKTRLDFPQALVAAGVAFDVSVAINPQDLTMGELQRVLECPENWEKVGIGYDRATFCQALNTVRETRNAVMHFRDLPDNSAFQRMLDFAAVVQRAYLALTALSPGLPGQAAGDASGECV